MLRKLLCGLSTALAIISTAAAPGPASSPVPPMTPIGRSTSAAVIAPNTISSTSSRAGIALAYALQTEAVAGLAKYQANSYPGVDPTGATDSTAALVNLAASVASSGGGVINVCGTYMLTAPFYATGTYIVGCGAGGATFNLTTPAQNGIVFGGGAACCTSRNEGVFYVTVNATVTKTAGSGISCVSAFRCEISGNTIQNQLNGIESNNSSNGRIYYNYVTNNLNGGYGIWLHGGDVANQIFHNSIGGATHPAFCVEIGGGVNGEMLQWNLASQCAVGLKMDTSDVNQPIKNMFFLQNQWDSGTGDGEEWFAGSSQIYRIDVIGEWSATNGGSGLRVDASDAGGILAGVKIASSQFINNGQYGVVFNG